MLNKVKKFIGLSRYEKRDFIEAWLMLPVVAGVLRLRGVNAAIDFPAWFSRGADRGVTGNESCELARIAGYAARNHLLRTTCLENSLVLWRMLRRRGVESDLRFGARKDGDRLDAHAWVEYGGMVLNDRADIAHEFKPFRSFTTGTTGEAK